ncbi:MAG: MerR family transcriptional regulator [Oscillospiraceae bacterium]|jgi:DNA-binding transcriptional MerR regulator|nr:MerR family transcriptional regulator [Oscillospiraceae bacterium]
MKYKIGDVSRILGISTDLLRYYEKKGVVKPQKDKNNDYRYYDTWDINFLIDCLWYKSFGFGISQIAYMVTQCWHGDLVSLTDEKCDELESTIRRQELLLEQLKKHRDDLARVKDCMYVCDIVPSPEIVSYLNRFNSEYADSAELQRLSSQWLDYMPFAQRYFEIPQDGLTGEGDDYAWGFSLSVKLADELGVPVKPPVVRRPSRMSIHSAFKSSGKNAFTPRHLDFMLEFAEKNGYTITDRAAGNLVCSVIDDDVLTGYFEVWLPIE